MGSFIPYFVTVLLASWTGLSQAANIEAGKAKFGALCVNCHGANGVSTAEGFPNLAGQKSGYVANALRAYRDKSRTAALMNAMAANLTDAEIEDLAAYLASLKPCE
jgi:cytochrome c553